MAQSVSQIWWLCAKLKCRNRAVNLEESSSPDTEGDDDLAL